MRHQAVIRVGLKRLTFVPIVSEQLVHREERRAMTAAPRLAPPAIVGGLLRDALARSSERLSLRGLRRATVETLFVPPPSESASTEEPPPEPRQGALMVWASATETTITLRPHASLGHGQLPIEERKIILSADATDEELGLAIRRAVAAALHASILQRIALAPLRLAEWLARRFHHESNKSAGDTWIPPAGRG